MKSAHRSILLCLIAGSMPVAVACGSNDMSGLFSPSGGDSAVSSGGSLGASGTSGHAGQGVGGQPGSAGSSGSSSGAGQGSSAAGAGTAGSGVGGMGVSGNAGATSGGNPGAGGSHAGSAGASAGVAGMSGSSGAPAGGAGRSAGTGGSDGGGGSGGTAAGCPFDGQPPQNGDVCTMPTPDNCFYSGEACSCLSDGQGATRHWSCYGTPAKCPTANDVHPMDGASCKGFNGGLCPYSADDFCVCAPTLGGGGGADPKWACSPMNPTCPDMRPATALCGNEKECVYADRACFCAGSTWTCQ